MAFDYMHTYATRLSFDAAFSNACVEDWSEVQMVLIDASDLES